MRYSSRPTRSKPPSWLSYTAALHRALLVSVTVLAVAVTEEMERWCARPYPYNHLGGTFRPLVIGPSAIPRITDVEQARALPELALRSVAAHGQEPDAETLGITAFLATGAPSAGGGPSSSGCPQAFAPTPWTCAPPVIRSRSRAATPSLGMLRMCGLEIWHGVGHHLPRERPDWFVELLGRFVASRGDS